jgi:hypothetical protein
MKRILPGRIAKCPSCGHEVKYSWLSGMSGPHIHLYAVESNDVLIRKKWAECIESLFEKGLSDESVLSEIDTLLDGAGSLMKEKYSVASNVKCPVCKTEFPYRFKGNLKMRLDDQEVVLIDRCVIDSDSGIFVVEVELI